MTTILIRGGTTVNWNLQNPILDAREPGVDIDLLVFKVGDGVRPWSELPAISGGGAGGGVTEHGQLQGLGEDDHQQYALANGSRGDFASSAEGELATTAVQPATLTAGLAGKIDIPGTGGYNMVLQFSTNPNDNRSSPDTAKTSVLWITTYSSDPVNATSFDQQKVVLA